MSDVETFSAPVLPLPPSAPGKWDQERQAFEQQLPQLLANHRGQYVAIHQGQVVDRGDNLVALAERVYAQQGYVPIYMDLVAERPSPPLHIPRYRPLREGEEWARRA
jgi:hypothetical protein